VLRSLLAELELSMALAGCASLADIGPELLARIP
jgi:isopentenyl diphosphate isomerase/L-lactate dehydrogenase-like FMN-dependent dehydrogenase